MSTSVDGLPLNLMPLVDKPNVFCRQGFSDLWDMLQEYVAFIETVGVESEEDCWDLPMPTNDEIEDKGLVMMCGIYRLSPIARCVIPINATSFIEVDCPPPLP